MPNIREFEPILPNPQPYVEKALELYKSWIRRKQGRVVFIEGELGGGKTELLGAIGKALHQTKPTPNFVAGYFSRGEYKPYSLNWREPICLRRALNVAGGLSSLLGFFPVQYAFAASLIGQAIETCVGAQEFAGDFTRQPHEREQYAEHLKTKLRHAAEENPTIVLLDDWDEAQRYHWDSMLLSFAREIAVDLPILIVVTVKAPINLDPPAKGGPSEVIKSLTEKGLAELWKLEKLSPEEVAAAIGSTLPSIAARLHGVTGGNAHWVQEVWREWRLNEVVVINDGDRWLWNSQRKNSTNLYADVLEDRLKRILKNHPVMEIEQAREVLACAALEGSKFTADAVAWALNWDRDELIDLLDELVQSEKNPDGVLLEEGFVNIPTVSDVPRTLCLYSFVSDLHWFALDRFGFANEQRPGQRNTERNEKSMALIEGLTKVYQTEDRLVAAPLARLLSTVGDLAMAKHYKEMAAHTVGREIMGDQALNLLAVDKIEWEHWQCERASRFLIEAGRYMLGIFQFAETFSVFNEAAGLARRAKDRDLEAKAHTFCSEGLSHEGRYAEATERAAIALAIFRDTNNRRGLAITLNVLANIDYGEGRFDDSREHASCSLAISEAIGSQIGMANSLMKLADIDFIKGCYEDARERANRCLSLCKDINDPSAESSALTLLAKIDRVETKYIDARQRAARALMINQESGNRQWEADTLFLLAQLDLIEGNYHDARERARLSLAIDHEIGNVVGEIVSLCLLAELDRDQGKGSEARDRAARSLDICQEIGHRTLEASSLHVLTKIDRDQGRYGEAREHAALSLAICEEIGYQFFKACSLELLAQIDRDEGKYRHAVERAALSLAIYRNLGSRLGEAKSLRLLAEIDRDEGKYAIAKERAALSLAICVEIGTRRREADALRLLSQIDRDEGKYIEARERANVFLAISQELRIPAVEAAALHLLAEIDRDEGKYDEAMVRASESLAIRRRMERPADKAASLHLLAQIDLDEGRSGDARKRATRSLTIAQEIGHYKQALISSELLAQINNYEGRDKNGTN